MDVPLEKFSIISSRTALRPEASAAFAILTAASKEYAGSVSPASINLFVCRLYLICIVTDDMTDAMAISDTTPRINRY